MKDGLPILLTPKQAANELSVSLRHFRDRIMPLLNPVNVSPKSKRPTWRISRDKLISFANGHRRDSRNEN